MDIRQSENYAKYIKSLGWTVERVGKGNIFIRKLGPTAVIKIQRPEEINLAEVEKVTQKYHPLLIKIEPTHNSKFIIHNLKFQQDSWPLLPTKTIVINLKSSICNRQSLPKDTRYEIRKAEEKGLTVTESHDINLFYKLLQETMKIGGWSIPINREVMSLYKSFQSNNSVLLFTTVNREPVFTVNQPVAACLLIWDGDTAHYMYAALTKSGRQLGAAYFLLWKTIKFCQKKGLKHLDLEGVYDERFPLKHWRGFTKFKQGWGGKEISYPGSFTKYANPFVKLLFSLT